MVGKSAYSGVPTVAELENNGNQKKYTVNRNPDGLVIARSLCFLMAIGALLLAVLVGLLVFFLIPRCSEAVLPQASDSRESGDLRVSDGNLPLHSSSTVNDLLKIPSTLKDIDDADERLPTNIQPQDYRIWIKPYLYNLTFDGTVEITLFVKDVTNIIVFNINNIKIDKTSVKLTSAGKDKTTSIENQNYIKGERYKIVLKDNLQKNVIYLLEMKYLGNLNNHLQGFYRSYYDDHSVKKYLAATQFSPTDARRAFPCFDEPSFKANFSLIIARPSNMTSLANMPIEKSDAGSDKEWVWDYYKTTPKMSTYLVAFLLSEFQPYGSADKRFTVWSQRNSIIEATYSAQLLPKILGFYETYFNLSFPLPKIDIVAVPDFGYNAMENWGLITFRESALLYNDINPDIEAKRTIATILSHELAHQWFGNLVTPKWWTDLWLKEGFSTYFQYLGTNFSEPSWQISDEFIFSETERAFSQDAFESSRPISFEVKNSRQIRQVFDDLSYAKGAAIIRMMHHFLGDEIFRNGLIRFLKQYQYSNANHDDLFEVLNSEVLKSPSWDSSISVKTVMDTWTDQAGFPVLTAIRDVANKKLIISQKRFLYTTKANSQGNSSWWIPISMVTDLDHQFNNTQPTVWLKNEPMKTVNLDVDSWFLINTHQTGYYIVNYDEGNWRYLTENLITFPPVIRAQLISDSMDLARANLLDYDIPLKMIQIQAIRDNQIMYIPTKVLFNKLQYLSDMLSSTPAFGLFESYVSTIFRKSYNLVNSDTNYNSEIYLNERIRKLVLTWACKESDSECAINFHKMFRQWMADRLPIPANIRDIVYCTGIRQGSEAEWEFAFNRFLDTSSATDKNSLSKALGCTTKKWLLSKYLDALIRNDSSIRIQDASQVFNSVCDNSISSGMAFDFLRTHWNELLQYYGEGFNIISKMVKSLPRYMNTDYQLLELLRFRNEIVQNISTATQAFDSAIEQVKANVEWMKNNYVSVENWLITHKDHFHL